MDMKLAAHDGWVKITQEVAEEIKFSLDHYMNRKYLSH